MAECFWTDMVGCAEDCAAPAPTYGYFCWDTNANEGDSATTRRVTFGDTFAEAMGLCPPASNPDFLDVSIVHVVVYISGTGDVLACDWRHTVIAAHGETTDTSLDGCMPDYVWKEENFYATTASATAAADVNYAIPIVNDGAGDYPSFSFDDLCTLSGLPTGDNGAFKVMIRDNVTGNLYLGGGAQNTCY